MVRKKRDYKAEYARRRARSLSLGYKSPRQEYRARKAVGMDRSFPSLRRSELPDFVINVLSGDDIARIRRENAEWSKGHSWVKESKYTGRMSNRQARDYNHAYVQRVKEGSRRGKAKEKKLRIFRYLQTYFGVNDKDEKGNFIYPAGERVV